MGYHTLRLHSRTKNSSRLIPLWADNKVNEWKIVKMKHDLWIRGDVAWPSESSWDSPLRKLRWLSKIWTTSLTQALQISGEEASNWKRTTLPSGLRDVSTKRASSPSTMGSTPRQLTWNISHLMLILLLVKSYANTRKHLESQWLWNVCWFRQEE